MSKLGKTKHTHSYFILELKCQPVGPRCYKLPNMDIIIVRVNYNIIRHASLTKGATSEWFITRQLAALTGRLHHYQTWQHVLCLHHILLHNLKSIKRHIFIQVPLGRRLPRWNLIGGHSGLYVRCHLRNEIKGRRSWYEPLRPAWKECFEALWATDIMACMWGMQTLKRTSAARTDRYFSLTEALYLPTINGAEWFPMCRELGNGWKLPSPHHSRTEFLLVRKIDLSTNYMH